MPNGRTSPPTRADEAGRQCGPCFCHDKLMSTEAGSEKRRVACPAVVLETFLHTVAAASGPFPWVGEVAHGSRWVQEGEHATY